VAFSHSHSGIRSSPSADRDGHFGITTFRKSELEARMSLSLLRGDPLEACKSYRFRTGPKPGSFKNVEQGGACTISCSKAANNIYDLEASDSAGSDYFYPWLQRGVGWVRVPKTISEGTSVMTGGVNGCTLVVSETLGHYYFYHDGDSKYLTAGQVVGNEIARVEPKDYDKFEMGNKLFRATLADTIQAGKEINGDLSYGHFVIAVRKGGKFGFYVTGVMSINGLTALPYAITPLIVTFGGD